MSYLASTRIYHLPILSGIGLDIPGAPEFVDPTEEQIYAQTVENQLYGIIKMHNGGNGVIVEGEYENVSTTIPIVEVTGLKAFINQIYVEDHNRGFVFSGLTPSVSNYLFLELTETLDTLVNNPDRVNPPLVLGNQSSRRFGNAKPVTSTSSDIGPNSILISKVILDYQGYGQGGYGEDGYGHSESSGDFFTVDVDLEPPGKIHLTSVLEHAADNTDPHGPIFIVDQLQSSGVGVAGTTISQSVHVTDQLNVQGISYLNSLVVSGLVISSNLEVFGPAVFSGQSFIQSAPPGGDKTFGYLIISSQEVVIEIDNFEDGLISNEFTFEGNLPWIVENTLSYEGTKSVRSGAISDSQTSKLVRTVIVPNETLLRIEFYYNVSSEPGADFFTFEDNAVTKLTASGEIGWTKFSITLGSGAHTLKWIYTKDSSISTGRDSVNVDNITFTKIYNGGLVSRTTSEFVQPIAIQTGGYLGGNLQVASGVTIDGIDVSTLKFLEDGSEADNNAINTLGHTHHIRTGVKHIFISPEYSGVIRSGVQLGTLNTLYDNRNNFYRFEATDDTAQVRVITKQIIPEDFVTFSGITLFTRTSTGLTNTSGVGFSLIDSVGNVVKKQFIKRPSATSFSQTRLVSGISGNFIPGRYFGMQFDFYGELNQTVDLSEIVASYNS